MKKLFVGLMMAALTFTGVAFAPAPVHAAPAKNAFCDAYPDQCTGTDTRTQGRKQYRKGGKATPKRFIRVRPDEATNMDPEGEGNLVITVRKPDGSIVQVTYPYDGAGNYPIPGLRTKGKYRVIVRFVADEDSTFEDSRDAFTLRVKGKKKRRG